MDLICLNMRVSFGNFPNHRQSFSPSRSLSFFGKERRMCGHSEPLLPIASPFSKQPASTSWVEHSFLENAHTDDNDDAMITASINLAFGFKIPRTRVRSSCNIGVASTKCWRVSFMTVAGPFSISEISFYIFWDYLRTTVTYEWS